MVLSKKWQKVERHGGIPACDSDLKSILSLTYNERILYRILRWPSCIIGSL